MAIRKQCRFVFMADHFVSLSSPTCTQVPCQRARRAAGARNCMSGKRDPGRGGASGNGDSTRGPSPRGDARTRIGQCSARPSRRSPRPAGRHAMPARAQFAPAARTRAAPVGRQAQGARRTLRTRERDARTVEARDDRARRAFADRPVRLARPGRPGASGARRARCGTAAPQASTRAGTIHRCNALDFSRPIDFSGPRASRCDPAASRPVPVVDTTRVPGAAESAGRSCRFTPAAVHGHHTCGARSS